MKKYDVKKLVRALATSYSFKRSNTYLSGLIQLVLLKVTCSTPYNSNGLAGIIVNSNIIDLAELEYDTDIFYGTLVIYCGDYCTSPRFGWIEPEYKNDVIQALKDEFDKVQHELKRSDCEDDFDE